MRFSTKPDVDVEVAPMILAQLVKVASRKGIIELDAHPVSPALPQFLHGVEIPSTLLLAHAQDHICKRCICPQDFLQRDKMAQGIEPQSIELQYRYTLVYRCTKSK